MENELLANLENPDLRVDGQLRAEDFLKWLDNLERVGRIKLALKSNLASQKEGLVRLYRFVFQKGDFSELLPFTLDLSNKAATRMTSHKMQPTLLW